MIFHHKALLPRNRFLDYPDLFFYTHFSDPFCHIRLAGCLEKSDGYSGKGALRPFLESNIDERGYLWRVTEASVYRSN